MEIMFFTLLRGIWCYLQVDLSSPLRASLYNIGMRLWSQRTTSSSSKYREKIRWRRLFVKNEYEGKQNHRKFGWILKEI